MILAPYFSHTFRMNQFDNIEFQANESFPYNALSHFNIERKTIIMTQRGLKSKFKEYIRILILESRLPLGHFSFFTRRWATLPPNLHLQKINGEQRYLIIIESPDRQVTTQVSCDNMVTTVYYRKWYQGMEKLSEHYCPWSF